MMEGTGPSECPSTVSKSTGCRDGMVVLADAILFEHKSNPLRPNYDHVFLWEIFKVVSQTKKTGLRRVDIASYQEQESSTRLLKKLKRSAWISEA